MEDELYLIGHILQERPDLGYVSEDEEDPSAWPEPTFEPRKRTTNKGSHHIKETVQEAEERLTFQSTNRPSLIQSWEQDKFWQYQRKCSKKNWLARRTWLNSRVQEQVEADFQKKIGIWRSKFEAEFESEVAASKLQEKIQELLKEKYWWTYQLEHQWELPDGIFEEESTWEVPATNRSTW